MGRYAYRRNYVWNLTIAIAMKSSVQMGADNMAEGTVDVDETYGRLMQ
jgi:hypothetical protein